ncbi:lipopolysaccharide biosynthesis protein [Streptococcus constellatus subsp. viborgensis]|uniref:lipopolysaccharide biosynthesis protein n=1 Tax=Streptococcus constellatus TaxID=76860 RepID=UPI0018E0D9F6|nr:lipopolysaccharide biosynthesis protein [Streptococcus constellatus]QQC23160.1 lipopolysaccharide biosynthesis protein [Streptococcus constellatus]
MKIKTNPSAKEIYFWNLLGNLAASGVSVLYLLIVTRLTSAKVADQFSLANSIGTLWIVIGLFQVRNYQGTDVSQKHSFIGYFQTRLITILAMLVTLYPYLYIIGEGRYSFETILLTFLMIFYRMWDAVSDLFQGLFQQRERMDIAGKTMFYRYSTSAVVLFLSILLSKSVIVGLFSLVIWNGLVIIFYETSFLKYFETIHWKELFSSNYKKDIKDIFLACWPLFVNGFILLYILNEPKIIIEKGLNQGVLQTGMQRDFNILFMPVFFMSLIILMVRPLITQMAILWNREKYAEFSLIVKKLLFYLFIGGIAITIVVYFIGTPILSLVFGVALSQYTLPFAILIFAGVLYALAIVFENILTIIRKQHLLVGLYIVLLVITKLVTEPFIYQKGMLGATISFFIVMFTYVIGNGLMYLFAIHRKRMKNE